MLHAYGIVTDRDLFPLAFQALFYNELKIMKEEYEQEEDADTIIKVCSDNPDIGF
jgi:hypothetical protein